MEVDTQGWFTFEAAVERCGRLAANPCSVNFRIAKALTGPLAGQFIVIHDTLTGDPDIDSMTTGYLDPSRGPNMRGDDSAFTLDRQCE